MTTSFVPGLLTGLSLIVAIGAQNAYVLRQGLRREHVGVVVAICSLSDLVLILAGVAGIGTIVERAPAALEVIRWLGVAFLTAYGLMSLWRARTPDALHAATAEPASRAQVAGRAVALTWLNPHVYLDTVLLRRRHRGHARRSGPVVVRRRRVARRVSCGSARSGTAPGGCTACSPRPGPGRCSRC